MGQETSTVINQPGIKKYIMPGETGPLAGGGEEKYGAFRPKTEDELMQESKKRRNEKIAAAIGDGLASLGNLFFATKGAPYSNQGGRPSMLQSTVARHNEEDKRYQSTYDKWQKLEEKRREKADKDAKEAAKEAEKNRKVKLGTNLDILESRWSDKAYIDNLYNWLDPFVTDENTRNQINLHRYSYEDDGEGKGKEQDYQIVMNPFLTGKDKEDALENAQKDKERLQNNNKKKIDHFNDKYGSFLKRDLLEMLLGDNEWGSEEQRAKLLEQARIFDEQWVPLR